jgi:hypothetical protein
MACKLLEYKDLAMTLEPGVVKGEIDHHDGALL